MSHVQISSYSFHFCLSPPRSLISTADWTGKASNLACIISDLIRLSHRLYGRGEKWRLAKEKKKQIGEQISVREANLTKTSIDPTLAFALALLVLDITEGTVSLLNSILHCTGQKCVDSIIWCRPMKSSILNGEQSNKIAHFPSLSLPFVSLCVVSTFWPCLVGLILSLHLVFAGTHLCILVTRTFRIRRRIIHWYHYLDLALKCHLAFTQIIWVCDLIEQINNRTQICGPKSGPKKSDGFAATRKFQDCQQASRKSLLWKQCGQ